MKRETITLRIRPELRDEMVRVSNVLKISQSRTLEFCLENALPRIVSDQITQIAAANARLAA